jgi:asparagine synthase (glutamine-hydrolysing)
MCGITGFLDRSRQNSNETLSQQVEAMMNSIQHRGPDDSGLWTDPKQGVALGFRRLAILDLSPTGHQPMFSSGERYAIIFNGEIYNFAELRAELSTAGHAFRGTSDTEIMLAGILEWGLENAVSRLNGMYAIALWDRHEEKLHLIRDRLGVKPLYYGWCGNVFLFGSELKTLRSHPAFNAQIDRDALTLYFRHDYIPAPNSIYQGIKKLLPGTILTFDARSHGNDVKLTNYWSINDAIERGMQNRFAGTDQDAVSALDRLLRDSVRDRMIADVPLGAFLSGGIDSSTIVALMQAQSREPVKTFTIGFEEASYNESGYARVVAQHLGTDHTELYVTSQEAMNVVPCLPELFDEPFGDSSQIPTFLVSKLARRHVTVSLSGDGGDELFGGYSRYLRSQRIWNSIRWIPQWVRTPASKLSGKLSDQPWQNVFSSNRMSTRLYYLSEVLGAETPDSLYGRLISHWEKPEQLVRDGHEAKSLFDLTESWPRLDEFSQRMMLLDFSTYLPDDILVKLDRASMGASLEGRVPFLDDHRVIEFAWSLPLDMKIRRGQGKWILRQVLDRYVPRQLVERPKMGFGVPVDMWLRGPMRDWAESLLDEKRIEAEGFLNPEPIRRKWQEHVQQHKDWQFHLWSVLMFQAWLECAHRN